MSIVIGTGPCLCAILYGKKRERSREIKIMQKNITASFGGSNAKVGEMLVNRLVPNRYIHAVGPFVFLDHLYPVEQKPTTAKAPNGEFAHPHRGIATFSYLFSGELEHFDSAGHHGIVSAGGAQWMKAGNGVVHDEHNSPAFQEKGGILHAVQFWINLPSINKAEKPDYLGVHARNIPEAELPNDAGIMRILIGSCGVSASPVPTFSDEFIYHIRLNPKSVFTLPTHDWAEYAAFIPAGEISINGQSFANSELVTFSQDAHEIELSNNSIIQTDILIFGGRPYNEPIVAQGPFVMNSHEEIATAYKDFFNGKYGEISYQNDLQLK